MYWEDGNLRISPSDLIVFLESEFASWMDRWSVDNNTAGPAFDSGRTRDGSAALKLEPLPDEEDPQSLLFAQKGMQHETAFLEDLKQQGRRIVEIGRENSAFDTTFGAMKEGTEFIYQAGSRRLGSVAGLTSWPREMGCQPLDLTTTSPGIRSWRDLPRPTLSSNCVRIPKC